VNISKIVEIVRELPCQKIAIIAPDVKEAELIMHRFSLSPELHPCACRHRVITFDGYTIEFLTPHESMTSGATYMIVEFAENIPEPDMQEITPDICCGEIT